jgi:voltage-gated potassium channel
VGVGRGIRETLSRMPDAELGQHSAPRTLSPERLAAYKAAHWPVWRRVWANLIYLRKPFRDFLPLFVSVLVLVVIGGIAFHNHYELVKPDGTVERLSLGRALYIVWALCFMEHLLPWPEGHWVLEAFYLLMPPVGLVMILDGFVRFSYHIFRRDETGRAWLEAVTQTYHDHVVLCGLGKVGIRVLQKLVALDENVVVLEKSADCENLAWARRHGVPVRVGSGREEGVWEDLNIAQAKSIILATDDDLANLEMALDARKVKPDIRVVLRMFDQELAEKIRESFDIQLAFSTAELAAPLFATSSSDASIVNAFYVGERLLVVARIRVRSGSELIGQSVGELGKAHLAFVLTHRRDGRPTLHPADATVFTEGDLVTIQCEPDQLRAIQKRNRAGATVV